jgi:perosamine synthetase
VSIYPWYYFMGALPGQIASFSGQSDSIIIYSNQLSTELAPSVSYVLNLYKVLVRLKKGLELLTESYKKGEIKKMKIPISKPFFSDEEKKIIQKPLDTGWVVQGPYVREFENLFCQYTGAKHGIATTSCTSALHLALIAAGIKEGDEVVIAGFTWVATANVVEMVRAVPIFADIDLDTYNIHPEGIEELISNKTKAIIPVSLFGLSVNMGPILEIANKHNLIVIEDDACATGAWYEGQHAGTRAHLGCFSFHPRKAITTGEGGMVITNNDAYESHLRSLRDHGASISDHARHHNSHSYVLPDFNMVGYNYRMTDIQGALGVAQMARLETILNERRKLANIYNEALADIEWLQAPVVPDGYVHGYQSYVSLFKPEQPTLRNVLELNIMRNLVMDQLDKAGIATRPGTQGVHLLDFYKNKYNKNPEDLPNTYFADKLTISLPLFMGLTSTEQNYIIESLQKIRI